MNLDNPIEIQLKHVAKRMGFCLRRLPQEDPWYPSMGPYYLANKLRDIGRVRHQGLSLHGVFDVLEGIKVANRARRARRQLESVYGSAPKPQMML